MSKKIMKCLISYASSVGAVRCRRKALLRGWSLLLSSIEGERRKPMLRFDFAKRDVSKALNQLHTRNRIRVRFEHKGFETLDILFPFANAFVDLESASERENPTVQFT